MAVDDVDYAGDVKHPGEDGGESTKTPRRSSNFQSIYVTQEAMKKMTSGDLTMQVFFLTELVFYCTGLSC
jgi:hypothetical protein